MKLFVVSAKSEKKKLWKGYIHKFEKIQKLKMDFLEKK